MPDFTDIFLKIREAGRKLKKAHFTINIMILDGFWIEKKEKIFS